ncbi:MAG: Rne/Rng family ribonuclease [Bacteroidia bacterium]|nr:Rne/Rng family ribonuclease [Bacteroidia bacterium]
MLVNELVVSANDEGLRIGILENRRIVELHHEKTNKLFSVGDICLGRVKKLVPGLNAAFVDIGHPKDAFLHYLDLGPQVMSLQRYVKAVHASENNIRPIGQMKTLPDINKHGKMAQVLKANQFILVQVVKEAISTKGPRLSCEVSLPGQYVILVPFSNEVSISRKIPSAAEKKRLRVLMESIKPKNFGVIVRTAAEGKEVKVLEQDLKDLVTKWEDMANSIVKAKPPKRVLKEEVRTTSIIRDMLQTGFDAIHTDDPDTFEEIQSYLGRTLPDSNKILKFHKGKVPLFESLNLEKQIKASFGKTVTMQNGSYLVIEHTEALHVIDVNSGSKNLRGATLEDNALKTNMEAASEIARQLRLRDMGGIIVIDFIDLKKPENKKALYEHFRDQMKSDRAKHTILPMSRFGLVQITRQRVRPELSIITTEKCPSCAGTGKMQSSILISDDIANNVDFLMKQNKEKVLTLLVNPYVGAFLRQGVWNYPRKWFFQFWRKVKVLDDNSLGFTEVRYINSKGEEIKL